MKLIAFKRIRSSLTLYIFGSRDAYKYTSYDHNHTMFFSFSIFFFFSVHGSAIREYRIVMDAPVSRLVTVTVRPVGVNMSWLSTSQDLSFT